MDESVGYLDRRNLCSYYREMKYIYFLLILAIGFVAGRLSVRDANSNLVNLNQTDKTAIESGSHLATETAKTLELPQDKMSNHELKLSENSSLMRTDDKARDKQIRQLFSELMEANEKNQIEEQNQIFREMESLNPRHEKVYQARAQFLQDDEDCKLNMKSACDELQTFAR